MILRATILSSRTKRKRNVRTNIEAAIKTPIILLFILTILNVHASECTFSLDYKFTSNKQHKTDKLLGDYSKLTKNEKEFVNGISRYLENYTDCRKTYSKENSHFHIELEAYEYEETKDFLGLVYSHEYVREASITIIDQKEDDFSYHFPFQKSSSSASYKTQTFIEERL